jgi:hypothetical protein
VQKIEKWRVQELAMVLEKMSELFKDGGNAEWGSVFLHFSQETKRIFGQKIFNPESLGKLVLNIRGCFSGLSSLKNIVLVHSDRARMKEINREFLGARGRLLEILDELDARMIELIH